MSCNTHWLVEGPLRTARSALLTMALVVSGTQATASHPALPEGIASGPATLRVLGIQVYNARLWAPAPFNPAQWDDAPVVLELEYLRNFSGVAIADRSIVEMRRVGMFTDEQASRWTDQLRRVFPDVKSGDRIAGVHHPGRGVSFLFNDRVIGEISDAEFARLFFAIWLGPNTSEPGMRRQLLAQWLSGAR